MKDLVGLCLTPKASFSSDFREDKDSVYCSGHLEGIFGLLTILYFMVCLMTNTLSSVYDMQTGLLHLADTFIHSDLQMRYKVQDGKEVLPTGCRRQLLNWTLVSHMEGKRSCHYTIQR